MNSDGPLFARIRALFDIGVMSKAHVLVAGCGSGGGSVALQLAMSGLQNFTLIDNDVLEVENVIRHVCGRRYLGMRKTDALRDVLLDRNPEISVETFDQDLMDLQELSELVRQATVVISATDNDAARYRLNEVCVSANTPFVVGRVFTRGIGGEVFSYRPAAGGCLACLERVLERTTFREGVREIDLVSEEERDAMYGMEIAEIKDSPGLNVDISFISSFHTRFALDAIASQLDQRPEFLAPIAENYLVWGNRPVAPFEKHFQLQRMNLQPQDGCLTCGEPT